MPAVISLSYANWRIIVRETTFRAGAVQVFRCE